MMRINRSNNLQFKGLNRLGSFRKRKMDEERAIMTIAFKTSYDFSEITHRTVLPFCVSITRALLRNQPLLDSSSSILKSICPLVSKIGGQNNQTKPKSNPIEWCDSALQ